GPGTCPKCGMALEPKVITAAPAGTPETNPELADMTRRLWGSLVFAVPLLLLAMGDALGLDFAGWPGTRALLLVELALATPAVLWAGWPLLQRGWASVVHR